MLRHEVMNKIDLIQYVSENMVPVDEDCKIIFDGTEWTQILGMREPIGFVVGIFQNNNTYKCFTCSKMDGIPKPLEINDSNDIKIVQSFIVDYMANLWNLRN